MVGPVSSRVRVIAQAGGRLDVTLDDVPGSKSIANRALVCATLADGASTLRRVPPGDDTAGLLDAVRTFGAHVERHGDVAVIGGTGGELRPGPATIDTRLAGTTSRFVTALGALGAGPYLIDGAPPLRARPMAALHRALAELGAELTHHDAPGALPVTIRGGTRRGRTIELPGDVTSQFVTALMLIAPYFTGGLAIELTTPLVSRPYLELTATVMAAFGHDDVRIGERRIDVGAGRYRATDVAIEPDASSASYPLAAAAIAGGRVRVGGLGTSSAQGDARFADVLAAMGCAVERSEHWTEVRRRGTLRGIDIGMADISDTVPTLAVVAAFASTPTRIEGIGFIRRKESDRVGAVVANLVRLGVDAREEADGMLIVPPAGGVPALRGARIPTFHDHRQAMAFALAGLVVAGVEIEDPGVVAKSWPGYWEMIGKLSSADG